MTLMEVIVLTAAYYGRDISDEVLQMYAEDLSDLDTAQVIQAYTTWRRNPKNRSFPLPAQIRDLVAPELSEEDDAREAAARIVAAVPKFGWCNPRDAQEYIGELGWQVVQMQGGWRFLCENMRSTMIPNLQAQYRELAKTVWKKALSGETRPPALPSRKGPPPELQPSRKELEQRKQRDLAQMIKELGGKCEF